MRLGIISVGNFYQGTGWGKNTAQLIADLLNGRAALLAEARGKMERFVAPEPFAKATEEGVLWKGTRADYVYLPIDDAERLLAELRAKQDHAPATYIVMIADLANAIKAYEEADAE